MTSEDFERRLREIHSFYFTDDPKINGDFHGFMDDVRTLIREAMPEDRKDTECYCNPYEGCGCTVEDFNSALRQIREVVG